MGEFEQPHAQAHDVDKSKYEQSAPEVAPSALPEKVFEYPASEGPILAPSREPPYSVPSPSKDPSYYVEPTPYSGLEVVDTNPSGHGYGTHSPYAPEKEPVKTDAVVETDENPDAQPNDPRNSRRRKILIAIGIIIVVIAIALGAGLGVGLKKKNFSANNDDDVDPNCRESPELCIGGALGSQYYSKQGAFNGTGIAISGETRFGGHRRNIFTLYFQHWTGDIRFMHYTAEREWVGGTRAQTIATDAKNSTPIHMVNYLINDTVTFNLFYVSKDNIITHLTKKNASDIWDSGPLTDLQLRLYENSTNGMSACWKGNVYNDWDASAADVSSDMLGIDVWYATDANTFQQYLWYEGWDEWRIPRGGGKFTGKNAHAGVGCYSWGAGSTTYTMMVNQGNTAEILWKDTGKSSAEDNSTAPPNHPLNAWINATEGSIGEVYPTTSLGYTTYLYAQMADRSIQGFNVLYEAENTTIDATESFVIDVSEGNAKGIGGTRLTVTAFAEYAEDKESWDSLFAFYQTEGDDISVFTRPIAGGEWKGDRIEIPET